jgi:hypothetical protein
MKKFSLILSLVIGLSLVFGLTILAKKGTDADDLSNAFALKKDGTIMVDGIRFNNLSSYYKSEYFKVMGRRCKLVHAAPKPLENGMSRAMKKPPPQPTSDCDNGHTTIKPEYNNVNVTVDVVFHILHDNGIGDIPDAQCARQVQVLNQDYQGTGISFNLAGVTHHNNRHWHNDRREAQYKSQTGWDRDLYMNVWVNTASGYLGYAYYPDGSAGSNVDGIVLNYLACGGRNEGDPPYDQGRTLVHEAGHYFGLQHTFEGGCCNSYTCGDKIMDTNEESGPFYYCGPRETCGNPDPTTNFMDYSEDLCMYEFTPEQENRMGCSIVTYRPSL